MISASVHGRTDTYRAEFVCASPFPHIVIDDFFNPTEAQSLLDDFPSFNPENARNEFGKVGGKATVADLQSISPFYSQVHHYLASPEFLHTISELTGIADLIHDDQMFGGGTHENLEGQELDPHVDFNYLDERKLHRRLNLLLYLNKEWHETWGGCLELHSNPRSPEENQVKVIVPAFNRCVIFATSERSWHGFAPIALPPDKKHLSRKLLSIYLYTRDRPVEEIAPSHGTFYVQRPIPSHLSPGCTLTAVDIERLRVLFKARDRWIEHYQKKELEVSDAIANWQKLYVMHVPLSGYARQEKSPKGFWRDSWIGNPFEVVIRPTCDVQSLVVRGELPGYDSGIEISVSINGVPTASYRSRGGLCTIQAPARIAAGEALRLNISADVSHCPARVEGNADDRELIMRLDEILLDHGNDRPDTAALEGDGSVMSVLRGSAQPEGPARGLWKDGWISEVFEARLRLTKAIEKIVIEGYLPEEIRHETTVVVSLNGAACLRQKVGPGLFALPVHAQFLEGELLRLRIVCDPPYRPDLGKNADPRELGIVVRNIQFISGSIPSAPRAGTVRRYLK